MQSMSAVCEVFLIPVGLESDEGLPPGMFLAHVQA